MACWVRVGYTAGSHISAIYNLFSRFAVYVVALCVLILVFAQLGISSSVVRPMELRLDGG